MAYAHDYLNAVLNRARDGMPPYGFQPNWADAPGRPSSTGDWTSSSYR